MFKMLLLKWSCFSDLLRISLVYFTWKEAMNTKMIISSLKIDLLKTTLIRFGVYLHFFHKKVKFIVDWLSKGYRTKFSKSNWLKCKKCCNFECSNLVAILGLHSSISISYSFHLSAIEIAWMNYESDLMHFIFGKKKRNVENRFANSVYKEMAFNSRQFHIFHWIMFTYTYLTIKKKSDRNYKWTFYIKAVHETHPYE